MLGYYYNINQIRDGEIATTIIPKNDIYIYIYINNKKIFRTSRYH